MELTDVPATLRDRLGHEAAAGLIELFTDVQEEWTTEMVERVGDRFRLTDENTKVRVEMAQGFAAVRQEMTAGFAALRQEMTTGSAALRQEMTTGSAVLRQEMTTGCAVLRQEMTAGSAALRQEMTTGFAAFRQELADTRFELLKWTFVFWVGQLFALAGFVAVLIRFLRPSG